MDSLPVPFSCPVCGEEVPPNAKACPECGACGKSGWNSRPHPDGLGLPDGGDEFDYGKFLEGEFGHGAKPRGRQRFWWWIALLVLIAFVSLLLHGVLLTR